MNIDLNNPLIQGIIASLIASFIFAFIVILVKRLRKKGYKIFDTLRRGTKEKTGLESYRKNLEEKILRISHPWMKEGQTLADILVPINFETKKETKREELEVYLAREFNRDKALRLLILGKPGSGKTIAMRVIARSLWTLDEEIQPVPVIMSFSDIKGITDRQGLEKKIIEKLVYYQFEQGKKDDTTAKQFVEKNLDKGKLFLLFDGYDELDKSARETATKLLNTFLGTFPQIPAAISSRTALYQGELAFDQLNPYKITMAPFTPFAILKFLSLWKFEGKKSSHELFEMINGKAHLSELASNPLMLTIITFLYSLPKYTLPDNRVEFYEQCTRALLEEWDRTKEISRANKYESHQKIAVLNRVAFEHVSTADINDELIHEDVIHRVVREEMERLSLRVEEYPAMEEEIVQNSGLLQFIPAADFRFPHRTFMEFFAASYLEKEGDYQDLLDLYNQDPEKWKEVLLLYMGLNKKKEYANSILKYLISDFEENQVDKETPNLLLFSALTQSAVPDPQLAEDILNLARQFIEKKPEKEVIEELGFIAANPRWAYGQKAKDILLELLNRKLQDDVFQQVIFSLMHAGDESLDEVILDNLKRINLSEFISKIGSKEKYFIHKLFSLGLPDNEKEKIVDGLKESGNLEILGRLLIENPDEYIKELAAFALFWMSKLDGFYDFLDRTEIGFLDEKIRREINKKFEEWGWRWNLPKTENGKKLAILICYYSASWIAKNQKEIHKGVLVQIHNRFRYITTGFLVEQGVPFHKFNLIGFGEKVRAAKNGLKKHWKNKINLNNFWYRLSDLSDFSGIVFYWLVSLAGIVGFIMYLLGTTSNSFYNFLYDPFTVKFLFFQFIIFFILNLCLSFIQYGFDFDIEALAYSASGVIEFLDFIHDEVSLKNERWIPRMVLLLSFSILFIPFHNILFNIAFFLHFFILGRIYSERYYIGLAIFDPDNIKKIHRFLK